MKHYQPSNWRARLTHPLRSGLGGFSCQTHSLHRMPAVVATLVRRITYALGIVLPGVAAVDVESWGHCAFQVAADVADGGHIPAKRKPIVGILL